MFSTMIEMEKEDFLLFSETVPLADVLGSVYFGDRGIIEADDSLLEILDG